MPSKKTKTIIYIHNKLIDEKYTGCKFYLHFKGKVVMKVGESQCSEDLHINYLYREFDVNFLNWNKTVWSRPKEMFNELVPSISDGKLVPRFQEITPKQAAELIYKEL